MEKSSGSYGEKLGYTLNQHNEARKKEPLSKDQPAVTRSQNAFETADPREKNGDAHQPY